MKVQTEDISENLLSNNISVIINVLCKVKLA